MEEIFLVAIAALTSLGAGVAGARRGLARRTLGRAAAKTLESLGWILIFAAANLGLAVVVVVLLRLVTGAFVSAYTIAGPTWLLLSLLQGLVFQWWGQDAGRAALDTSGKRP